MKFYLYIYLLILLVAVNIFSQSGTIEYSSYSDTMESTKSNISADSVFGFIKANEYLIDFADCNICKSRAHIMSRMMEKKFPGLNVYKVWLIADCKRLSQKQKYRYKKTVYLGIPGECSNWAYHVAPAALINGDTLVFDPSTQSKPVNINTWANNIIPSDGKGYIIYKENKYYLYPESRDDYFMDELKNWNTGEPGMMDNKYLRSIEEMQQAKHGYFEPWKFNYYMSELLKLIE